MAVSKYKLYSPTKGFGVGWWGESERHRLAAKGIKTRGRAAVELQRLSAESVRRKRERAEASKLLKILSSVVSYKRRGKGIGKIYTPTRIGQIYDELLRKGSPTQKKRADTLYRKIKFYESTGFRSRRAPKIVMKAPERYVKVVYPPRLEWKKRLRKVGRIPRPKFIYGQMLKEYKKEAEKVNQ